MISSAMERDLRTKAQEVADLEADVRYLRSQLRVESLARAQAEADAARLRRAARRGPVVPGGVLQRVARRVLAVLPDVRVRGRLAHVGRPRDGRPRRVRSEVRPMSDYGYFVSDYRPTKRIGLDELDGAVSILERRVDEGALERDPTPRDWMDEGARLALALIRDGNYRYPQDFVDVFDVRRDEIFGWEE